MSEIKFRGKRLDSGEWVYGDLLHLGRGVAIAHNFQLGPELPESSEYALTYTEDEIAVVIPDTIGQFTGLLDKNGNEIYEGDVVDFDNYLQGRSVVKFESGNFRVQAINYETIMTYTVSRHTRVIGNIHDNPELLNTNE